MTGTRSTTSTAQVDGVTALHCPPIQVPPGHVVPTSSSLRWQVPSASQLSGWVQASSLALPQGVPAAAGPETHAPLWQRALVHTAALAQSASRLHGDAE